MDDPTRAGWTPPAGFFFAIIPAVVRTLIELPNQRFLIASHSTPGRKTRAWIVYLPESGASFHAGSRAELRGLVGFKQASRFNYLVINKPGLKAVGRDRDVFERSFRRRLRINDALEAIHKVIPKGDAIFLVGYSEGAYLAPQLAEELGARVMGVAMIGGGTRGWLKEELSRAVGGREKAALARQVARIRQARGSLAKWNGFSYATWNSYAADSTLLSLKRLKDDIPLLAVLGRRDQVIDLKSTLLDLARLSERKNLTMRVFPACGHYFGGHWPQVRRQLEGFLRYAVPFR